MSEETDTPAESGETEESGETAESAGADAEAGTGHHGRRWLMVSVIVPITVALISAVTVGVQHWISHRSDPDTADTSTSAPVSPSAEPLPPADPIPAAWCFDCTPALLPVARDCRDGSMHACDDLWKSVADNKEDEPPAIHEYGISCGGRRQLRSPGYQYKDCSDEVPGHH